MEKQKTSIPVKYKFFIRIFVATFLGWAVPHIAYRLLQPKILTFTFAVNFSGVMSLLALGLMIFLTSGFLTGFWVSFAQWIALRPYIKSGWMWMISLVLIWIAGDILGYVIILIRSATVPYSQFDAVYTYSTLMRIVIVGIVTGLCVGIFQQIFLQKRTGIKLWWGIAGLFGVFSGILLVDANAAASPYYVTIDPIDASILAGLVFAGFASLPALLLKPLDTMDMKALLG